MATIITSLDKASIFHFCVQQFLIVYTYQDTNNDKNYVSVPVSIKIGKRMFHKYINDLKDKYFKQTKEIITYSL